MKFNSLHFGERIYLSFHTFFFQNKMSHLTIIYTWIKHALQANYKTQNISRQLRKYGLQISRNLTYAIVRTIQNGTSHVYLSIRAKYRIRILNIHTILMCICDFRENRCRERETFLMGLNKITFMRVLSNFSDIILPVALWPCGRLSL
jgi:hypothetical protein